MLRGIFVLSLSAALVAAAPRGQSSSTQPASASPGTSSINCSLWRTDAGFSSTIQLKNRLVTAPIAVTPALFMADGTEYDLPAVNIPASGVATINVNSSLINAPSSLANHISTHGSATLYYNGTQTAVIAQMAVGSTAISESYMSRFTAVAPGSPATQTLEGLWWARDAGIGGFIALSNAAAQARTVSVQALTAAGQVQPAQSFALAPHASPMLDLVSILTQQPNAGDAGGLRIQFTGLLGEVNVTGGLENRQEGYSAVIPFWQAPMAGMSPSATGVTIAHPGIMIGTADSMMGFPAGTTFTPYLALRNLTASAEQVNLTLYTEQGTALNAPAQSLQPLESRQVDMKSVLRQLGVGGFSGSLTLVLSHSGGPADLMSVAGSVDAKGTYVFEVDGRAAEQRLSKQSPYWSVKNGNDTMVTLWNPSGSGEDLMVTLRYAGGSGIYHFPVHLAPYATANIDVKELIANQSPDADSNVLPLNLQEGSFVFHNAKDVHGPLSVNVNVGIFNVVKGTCYYGTVECDGYYSYLLISPPTFFLAEGGGPQELTAYGQYSDGTTPEVNASWSSNNTSVATASDEYISGIAPGQATITASATLPAEGSYYGYNPSCASLQSYNNFTGTATATVDDSTPAITGIDPGDWNAGSTISVTFNGQNFGTNAPTLGFSPSSGISYTLSSYNDTQIIANVTVAAGTPNETVTVTVTSNGYNGQGFQNGGNGQSAQSQPARAAVHAPINTTEITVISWLDKNAFLPLPTGENSTLQNNLNGSFASCVFEISEWTAQIRADLVTSADVAYANAWLIVNSANTQPPNTITPSTYWKTGNFRLYNDYGGSTGYTLVGRTPNPCGVGSAAGQASQYNGATGETPAYEAYQIAEGRLGTVGQAVNQTINGHSAPWIWNVIMFDLAGNPSYKLNSEFPTIWVYTNGVLTATYPPMSLSTFSGYDSSYQFTPTQIPWR